MNNRLSLDALQVMAAIDDCGSFAGAATRLHRVPSAISHSVKKLEADLEVNLFKRAGRRLELTTAGEALLKQGRPILRSVAELESQVRMAADGWEAELTLVLDHLLPFRMLIPAIQAFNRLDQGTRVQVLRETETGPWDALTWRRADLAFGRATAGAAAPDARTLSLGPLDMCYVVATDHPLAALPAGEVSKVLPAFRYLATADTSRALSHPGQPDPVATARVCRLVDLRDKVEALRAGLGFGLLPAPLARLEISAGRLVELSALQAPEQEEIVCGWRAGEAGKALAWFVDYCGRDTQRMLAEAFA